MRTCERHLRAVVVYEAGVGDCPLCVAEDLIEELKRERDAKDSAREEPRRDSP